MKKHLVAGVAIGLLAFLCQGQRAAAQGTTHFLKEAAGRLDGLYSQARKAGYQASPNGFSLAGGWLRKDQGTWVEMYSMVLERGKSYRFIASGDGDTIDLDLRITDESGRVLKADVGTEPDAIVDFVPNETKKYRIQLRLYDSRNNLPCVCVTAMLSK
jgi:hypothetical protein